MGDRRSQNLNKQMLWDNLLCDHITLEYSSILTDNQRTQEK